MAQAPRGLNGYAFQAELRTRHVLVIPGEIMGLANSVRLSLTVSDAMVDYALPIFRDLYHGH